MLISQQAPVFEIQIKIFVIPSVYIPGNTPQLENTPKKLLNWDTSALDGKILHSHSSSEIAPLFGDYAPHIGVVSLWSCVPLVTDYRFEKD